MNRKNFNKYRSILFSDAHSKPRPVTAMGFGRRGSQTSAVPPPSDPSQCHVIMVGVGGVGKTCLTNQFVCGTFRDTYDPTRIDHYARDITIDDVPVRIDIIDSAGQDQFGMVRNILHLVLTLGSIRSGRHTTARWMGS